MIEAKNVHMEHLEDIVWKHGVMGARQSINFLQGLRDMLAGKSEQAVNTTVKWDGAPAIIVGKDNDELFVATKSYFNKTPVMYKTEQEINNADLNTDLADKLRAALKHLSNINLGGRVLQGDFLFTKKDLEVTTIDDEEMVVFHPNTIAYTVPKDSKLGQKILSSEIGIVFHTVYSDSTNYDFDISSINEIPNTWLIDANYQDVSGNATFTESETKQITKILSSAGTQFRRVNSRLLNRIALDPIAVKMILIHHNTFIREGKPIPNSMAFTKSLQLFLRQRALKEINALKTETGQIRKRGTLKLVLELSKIAPSQLGNIIELQRLIIDAKHIIIKKLNKAAKVNTLLKTKDGYRLTGEEGYVAIDRKGNAVKLIDRLEFSYANFSNEIIKGWSNDSRR